MAKRLIARVHSYFLGTSEVICLILPAERVSLKMHLYCLAFQKYYDLYTELDFRCTLRSKTYFENPWDETVK